MMDWLNRNAGALQGSMAVLTVLIALLAVIGVTWQIDAAERLQKQQSARNIYREFLSLSISRPEFSDPDFCALKGTPQEAAYENYVEYLLYTAEQVIEANADWEPVFEGLIRQHKEYVCQSTDWSGFSPDVQDLVKKFRLNGCGQIATCEKAKAED